MKWIFLFFPIFVLSQSTLLIPNVNSDKLNVYLSEKGDCLYVDSEMTLIDHVRIYERVSTDKSAEKFFDYELSLNKYEIPLFSFSPNDYTVHVESEGQHYLYTMKRIDVIPFKKKEGQNLIRRYLLIKKIVNAFGSSKKEIRLSKPELNREIILFETLQNTKNGRKNTIEIFSIYENGTILDAKWSRKRIKQ